MSSSSEATLSSLLTGVVEQLDISPKILAEATDCYTEVGESLAGYADDRGGAEWAIYPQGSVRLGTVVRPHCQAGDYDIDLVCVHQVEKGSVTQADLKELVGYALEAYVSDTDPDTAPTLDEGKRCWTLTYGRQFHMDILPSIPRATTATGIWLTDPGFHEWLPSDPIAYADWFHEQMRSEWDRVRFEIAKAARSSVADVPEWSVKTALQRGVQVLKRHRDIWFENKPDLRPPSIIITTLAALTYDGTSSVFEVVRRASESMELEIADGAGGPCVPNPVCPGENFADRWRTTPAAHDAFRAWLEDLREEVRTIDAPIGLNRVVERLSKSFGDDQVRVAAAALGRDRVAARDSGALVAATGGLAVGASGIAVKQHTFFGE